MIRFTHPLVLISLFAPLVFFLTAHRKRKSLILRLLSASLVILALAGLQVGRQRPQENVYFLVDRSHSVTAATTPEEIKDQLEAIVSANQGRHFGTIAFGTQAVITDPIGAFYQTFDTQPQPGAGTDLAAAVDLAIATLPAGGENQIVLASDGRITEGLTAALSAAQQARVPISTLPIGSVVEDDASLASLDLPTEVEVDRPFAIDIAVNSEGEGDGVLALYRDEQLLAARKITLPCGLTRFTFTDALTEGGAHTYRAVIRRAHDPIPQNDTLSTLVRTTERPQLLLVCGKDSQAIASLLQGSGKSFIITSALPSLEELSGYRQVILTGIPLGDLTAQTIATLQTFVGELGGGLVVVEGEQELRTFAGGGVEALLPVSYSLPQKAREASLAIVFLLDRSASMRGYAQGAAKIDILKEATAASINLLEEEALVGVIAFDRHFEWLVPIQPVGEGEAIYQSLRVLKAEGGTDIYYPLIDALNKLKEVEARMKHVLLFSDGKTVDEYRDFDGLFVRLEGQKEITLSAIAIGRTPNLPLLSQLVQAGHGTLYTVSDFSALPEISMQATQRLSRSRFITGKIAVDGPLAEGELQSLPPLHGYALTYPKPTAQVLLWAGGDPLFARWRLGLGQVGVLNTDLAGRWSQEWLTWNKGSLLLDTIITAVEPVTSLSPGLILAVDVTDEEILALADARDLKGEFVNFLDLEVRLLPSGETLPMDQVSAGLYQASFPVQEEGGYALRVEDRTRGKSAVLPLLIPYPAEYRGTGIDEEKLRRIAHETGGKFLEDEILPDLTPGGEAFIYVDVYPQLLLAALSLFLAELAIRKLPRRRRMT